MNFPSPHESSHGLKMFHPAPSIDSETGLRVQCQDEDISPESTEFSIYLMQNLRVGDSNCLTCFDSGASAHLVDGQLARNEELQLISNKTTTLGLIRGGSIMTEYGDFQFNLGPGEDGKYHEITAMGMESGKAGFGEYNLKDIAQEFKGTASPAEMDYILPEMVSGTKVHLLLGIKNTQIQPVLIKVLPTGVRVYLSPFEDVWGSRIIFAGPSKIFTQENKDQQRGSNYAVCFRSMGTQKQMNM